MDFTRTELIMLENAINAEFEKLEDQLPQNDPLYTFMVDDYAKLLDKVKQIEKTKEPDY